MRKRNVRFLGCALQRLIVLSTVLLWPLLGFGDEKRWMLGVHPFKPATELNKAFQPLVVYLSDQLNAPVTLHVAKDYQTHVDMIGRDEIDFAYIGPALYVELVGKYGTKPLLARQAIGGKSVFHGKIFVRSDSPIQSMADLKGKRFAFTETHSTMGYLMPRYLLWQAGIPVQDFSSYKFLGDHVNVVLGVLSGNYDAGAVKEDVFYQYQARGLREIATTEPISDHLFVASRHLADAKRQQLQKILLQAHLDSRGAAALQSLTPSVTGMTAVQDSDYDNLRRVLAAVQKLEADR